MAEDAARRDTIDLAHEPDFALGHLRVRPSLCQASADGWTDRLEPRVMQVLVALVRADGAVVSRDALIDLCWGGRIVGEDAINRTLGKLRSLARRADGAFDIETVARVGYVLTWTKDTAPAGPPAVGPRPPGSRWPLILAGSAVAGLAAVAIAWRAQAPAEWVVGDYQVLAGETGDEGWPDLSPDGRFLVYTLSSDGAPPDIWFRALSGGEPVRLVSSPDMDVSPVWSPNGDEIAFIRTDPVRTAESPPCRIFVKPVPDGLERLVGACQDQTWANDLDWSPDGGSLVFSESRNFIQLGARLRHLDLRSGTISDLTRPEPVNSSDIRAAVSPSGRTVALVRRQANQSSDIYTLDLREKRLNRIARDRQLAWVDWSPDGDSLFVASARSGPSELWAFDARGRGPPQRLLVGLQDIQQPSAARGLIAFQTTSTAQEIVRLGDGVETIVASGSVYPALDVSNAGVVGFISQDPMPRLWLQPAGKPARRLRDLDLVAPRDLSFAPDGARLAMVADVEDDTDIFLMDVLSGALSRLPSPGMLVRGTSWTPDGRALLRSGTDGRISGIAQLDGPSEARRTQLTGVGWPQSQATPYGIFAGQLRKTGVWRLEAGKAPSLVAPTQGVMRFWRVARGAVYVLEGDDPERRTVVKHPLTGGPPVEMASGRIELFAVDPRNGDLVLVRTVSRRQDIGLLQVTRR